MIDIVVNEKRVLKRKKDPFLDLSQIRTNSLLIKGLLSTKISKP